MNWYLLGLCFLSCMGMSTFLSLFHFPVPAILITSLVWGWNFKKLVSKANGDDDE